MKKAYFHNSVNVPEDNCKKAGSFYENETLKIQWIFKEAYGKTESEIRKHTYNDWWRWDSARKEEEENKKKKKTNIPRHAQRFSRFISFCLQNSVKNNNRDVLVRWNDLKKENNKESGIDTGKFKSALKRTSVVNIIEDVTLHGSTPDERLRYAWRDNKEEVFETIDDANPDVLFICVRPSFFKKKRVGPPYGKKVTMLDDFKKKYGSISLLKENTNVMYLEDNQKNRFIVAVHHLSQGFSYDMAKEIIKEYCDWKKIPK